MDSQFPTFRRLAGTRVSLPFIWRWYTTAAQRRGLLRLIAVGIEEKLPLVPLLESWTADQGGIQHYRLHRLLRLLKDGTPLADAVEQIPGILRDEDILAIRFDAQSGTVTTAVREILDDPHGISPRRPSGLRNNFMYFGTVLLMGLPVVVFIQMKIMPQFNDIFHEFNLEPPSAMEWSQRIAGLFASYWWLAMLAALIVLLSMLFARPGRFVRHAAGRSFGPFRDRRAADLLSKLAITTNAGRPLAGALSTLARYHFDSAIRHKLLFVRNEVEQGVDLWQSMNDVDLITNPEARVLSMSERVGNRSWALMQLAYGKNRGAMRYLERMSQLVLPVVVLLMGIFVLIQALGVFMPLTKLIHALAA